MVQKGANRKVENQSLKTIKLSKESNMSHGCTIWSQKTTRKKQNARVNRKQLD